MTRAANLAEAAGSGFAFRNRIINGRFDFWQRGTSVTYIGDGAPFLADRWGANQYQRGRHQRVAVTSPPTGLNAKYALQVGSSTTAEDGGGSRMVASQTIESVNCQDLAGQQVTLSFWVKFNSATFNSVANSGNSAFGNFAGVISFYTSTTDAPSRTTAADSHSYTWLTNGSLPTTWTKLTLTTTVPAGTNNILVRFGFDYTGSTTSADQNFYQIAQVQLEPGSVATPFEFRPYGTELALCQRYYQNINIEYGALALCRTTGVAAFMLQLIVQMRSAPSLTFPTYALSWAASDGAGRTTSSLGTNTTSASTISLLVNGNGLTSGQMIFNFNPGVGAYASSEL